MACEVKKDAKGTHWRIPAFSPKDKLKNTPCAVVDAWWSRDSKHKANEVLVIRQENTTQTADLIMLELGQVYDLIDALNKAVESI